MPLPDLGANLVELFDRTVDRLGDAPFLWQKRAGRWESWSWRRVAEESEALARCLAGRGVAPGDRVAIIADSRPEWVVADLAILKAGAVSVPVFTTYVGADYRFILAHAGTVAAVAAGGTVAQRLLPELAALPELRTLVLLDGETAAPPGTVATLGYGAALEEGAAGAPLTAGRARRGDDLACLIYTSGTGGRPKGVMLPHRSLLANIAGVWDLLEEVGLGDDVFLSFLPLSHAYEHTVGLFLPIAMGAQIRFAESVERLAANMAEVRPTFLPCVPRLYEVMKQRMSSAASREGGLKARLFDQAVRLGTRRALRGGRLPPHLALADMALERLVRDKVRARFGGRLKAMISGGAPLAPEVGQFLQSLGLPILQGYGQTEAGPIISVNPPGRSRVETVGRALRGVELRLAGDGEILVRGALVMKGYWADPAASAEALKDGWLHTGDIGTLDEEGYLRITDRKKDIIVNSGGENVAPQRVEGVLMLQPEIGQALVFGDRRPHLVALVVPEKALLERHARTAGLDPCDPALAGEAGLRREIEEALARANRQLTAVERVRRYHLLVEPFSIENGLMTPTMKLRRGIIYQKYHAALDALYGTAK
ncbi:AMP-dependent synthetase/ligase [Marinimicrococcus flavescens]|uniref:AMP-dependent synthetase/ligase n=1 Tax=Marinimicrococcus flavescens TaxID=3031815 RepID=A0AAP4D4P2_9PROT|nr:AMP-dependent synthetase/ligase [Marinimicrococcus flavescens]